MFQNRVDFYCFSSPLVRGGTETMMQAAAFCADSHTDVIGAAFIERQE